MTTWIKGKVIANYKWTESLFSLIIIAKTKKFLAGQFTKLALKINGEKIQRIYSYVNSPESKKLEFYISNIENGILSQNLRKLEIDEEIYIDRDSYGNFTISSIPECENLWMLSTGTAIGPFLSILQYRKNLERFKKIILVHSVRYVKDLNYIFLMKNLKNEFNGKLKIQSVVSREKISHSLYGRITTLIKSGELESSLKEKIEKNNTHIMLCGNPNMIQDMIKILQQERKMNVHSNRNRGNITFERYW
ncbi:ferredoxin-NADP reductase [Candidatus Riesia sp. GBBU]|nr:ferredoxin-NADP reductase [Candidatus Riesia sp. GBBU]